MTGRDAGDAPVLDADIRLHDALHRINDRRIGDHQIQTVGIKGQRRWRHAIPDHLAAATFWSARLLTWRWKLLSCADDFGEDIAFVCRPNEGSVVDLVMVD